MFILFLSFAFDIYNYYSPNNNCGLCILKYPYNCYCKSRHIRIHRTRHHTPYLPLASCEPLSLFRGYNCFQFSYKLLPFHITTITIIDYDLNWFFCVIYVFISAFLLTVACKRILLALMRFYIQASAYLQLNVLKARGITAFSIKNPMQNYFVSDALLLILIKASISSCRSLLIFESPAISRNTVKTALTVMLPW